MNCPLCRAPGAQTFSVDRHREYLGCGVCHLVFVPSAFYLSPALEKAEYDLHENSPEDEGYRRFLSRLFIPLVQRLPQGSEGLDFGCGPGPTLSVMFEEMGYPMAVYDSFYAPKPCAFDTQYDFVTATEVVEHLHDPGAELDRLWGCLRHGGLLGIMTKLVIDREAFSGWHYKNDLTHVCFFSRQTFQWLANHLDATLSFVGNDVIILEKNRG